VTRPGFQCHDIFEISEKRRVLKIKLLIIAQEETIPNVWNATTTNNNSRISIAPYGRNYVWWPWLTSNRVAQVCQHQLSFLLYLARLAWNCLFTSLLMEFLGILLPEWITIPQEDRSWAKTRRMSHKPWKSIHGFDLDAWSRKIQYNKKSQTVIFHLSGEKPPLNRLKWKFALV